MSFDRLVLGSLSKPTLGPRTYGVGHKPHNEGTIKHPIRSDSEKILSVKIPFLSRGSTDGTNRAESKSKPNSVPLILKIQVLNNLRVKKNDAVCEAYACKHNHNTSINFAAATRKIIESVIEARTSRYLEQHSPIVWFARLCQNNRGDDRMIRIIFA